MQHSFIKLIQCNDICEGLKTFINDQNPDPYSF